MGWKEKYDLYIKLFIISSGAYRTALCTGCNLNRKNQLFIPLYCHNFRGFDSHLILHALDLILDKARFTSLSRNSEQIITMAIGIFRFVDTMTQRSLFFIISVEAYLIYSYCLVNLY